MKNYETAIAYYFETLLPIEQCRYSMYHEVTPYNRVPQLIYRISDTTDKRIYDEIRSCIELFKGNLKWTDFQGFSGKKIHNHVISPVEVYEMQKECSATDSHISSEEYFGKERYEQLCEKAISDIPALYEHIKKYLPDKLRGMNYIL